MSEIIERKKQSRESEMSIETAILIAAKAHRGQVDLGGQPYILHPLRVMTSLAPPRIYNSRPFRQIDFMLAAILHDVIEDSPWTLEDLHRARCPDVVLEALDHLTRRKGNESYSDYIRRVDGNEIARIVKIEDLEDNLKLMRLRPSQITKHASLMERDYRSLLALAAIRTPEQETALKGEARAKAKEIRRKQR